MIADANEDGTISSPAMKRQIELVLKDSDTTCANATRFAKEQQTASNAGDAFDSVSRRVTARCIEAQKDVADFQATGSFNATMEGIQIATNQLKERTKLFCDRASGL